MSKRPAKKKATSAKRSVKRAGPKCKKPEDLRGRAQWFQQRTGIK